MALTVGEIAGIINIGVVLLQLTFPLLLVYILAGIVPARSNAITWSVAGRFLNGSWWPTILQTDGAATAKVSKRVICLSTLSTVGLLLIAAAAIVTPLGLHDKITATSEQASAFVYARDTSPIGQATIPRDDYNVSRACGWLVDIPCPGQMHGFYMTYNDSGAYLNWDSDDAYISTEVPDNLTALFSSGRKGDLATVASPFDIEFRSYKLVSDVKRQKSILMNSTYPDTKIDNYAKRTQGNLQYGDMIVLADDFVVRDGVVADLKKGGLGFRNHTLPENAQTGVDWTESILWLEPETECVENNLTVAFGLAEGSGLSSDIWLVDNGGIKDKPRDYPYIDLNETQIRPELYARAHKGAVLMNFNLRQLFKISSTNTSFIGKRFPLPSSSLYKPGVVQLGPWEMGIPYTFLTPDPRDNITLVESIGLVTSGYGGMDIANFSKIANIGGVIMGAPTNIDANIHNGRFDPGTNYSAPLISCSTSLRAFIMNVTFTLNGTSSLDNLRVRSAIPRTYATNATTPLWAVENTDNMNISDIQPIWGLVSDEHEHDPALWTIRRDFMYLPAGSATMGLGAITSYDSAAWGAPINTLDVLYNGLGSTTQLPDYTGTYSLPLKQKWQELSKTKEGIATMMALIWTDMTANYITSSRSQLNAKMPSVATNVQRQAQNIPASQPVQVLAYSHVIRYHVPYAIVAIVFLALYLVVLVIALGMCISRRSTLHLMRSLLNQTSIGRAVVIERHREVGRKATQIQEMKTKDWVRDYGSADIGIVKERKRRPTDHGIAAEYQSLEAQGGGANQDNQKRAEVIAR